MDTRASLSPFRAWPVLLALLFNAIAPVVSIAVPADAVGPLSAPERTIALSNVDPAHVNFTLEGCRDPSVNLELTNFVCADTDYTSGNLGKTWNELDLVPHRLTTSLGEQAAATTSYDVAIVADYCEETVADGVCSVAQGDHPGYDIISVPVINTTKSHASCAIEATGGAVGSTLTPGIGGTDISLYRTLTITQDKGSTCVFDYYERLALGSHLYPGSSLHSNLTNKDFGTAGVGARDVSIPVNEILPQELDKDMTATQGQTYTWDVDKSKNPASLDFLNTCADTAGARSAQVEITVSWTRSGPTASGATTITTNIYATNPAHRTITINVTDRIYEGADQSVLLDTASSGPVNVPANTSDMLVLTHTFTYGGSATTFNDVATATYTDLVTGVPVPGQTTAVASATTQPSGGAIGNSSVVVSDTESISGDGLSFSVAAPSVGAFSGYTAGTETTGPVNWSATVSDSGSVTFTKTVLVDEPRITSGSLSDTATITGDGSVTLDSDNEAIAITADAQVSLTISKTIPDVLTGDETVTFSFDVDGPGTANDSTETLTFAAGETSKSLTLTGLAPGSYNVHEQPLAGWNVQADKTVDLTLPTCSGTASFTNSFGAATAQVRKDTDPDGSEAGWKFFLNGPGATDLEVTTTDDGFVVFPFNLQEGSYTITEEVQDGWNQTGASGCSFTVDYPADAGEIFSCTITNAAVGVDIQKWNDEEIDGDGFVVRGQEVDYTIKVTITNGPADNVVVTDTLPDGLTYKAGSAEPDDSPFSFSVGTNLDGQQVLRWEVDELASGDHFFTYTAIVDDDAAGVLENEACVDTDDSDQICDVSDVEVIPPTVEIVKENNATGTVTRGSTVHYTLTVTVTNGPAHDVVVTDELPDGVEYKVGSASPATGFSVSSDGRTLTWNAGTLDGDGDGTTYTFEYDGLVASDAPIGEEIVNVGCVAASDDADDDEPPICDDSTIIVSPPEISIVKSSDFDGETVLRGQTISFEVEVTVIDGPMHNAVISDTLPDGLTYVPNSADPTPTEVSGQVITWEFDTLDGTQTLTYQATVDADASGTLANLACVDTDEIDELLCDQTTTTVRIPTLVIDKVASAETITIDGAAATPSSVTWTLSYTLTNGPVTGAVITDPVPTGFTFVSASNGGTYDAATRTITWNLGTLSTSGSVTFVTTVDVATISRTAATVNVATIDSNETAPDTGQDSVNVEVEPPPLASTPTPRPSVPNTAAGIGPDGTPLTVPLELLVAFFVASLGALTLANVRAAARRRR